MTSLGEILRNKRLEKKLTLADVEKATKIRRKFLEALEVGRYDLLPAPTFVRGFVRNYAAFLDLPIEEVLAFYRREEREASKLPEIPARGEIVKPRFALTPRIFTIAGIAAFLLIFLAYLFGQYLIFTGAPFLSVSQPADYQVTAQPSVTVSGKTDPQATVLINGQIVTLDDSGNFNVEVPLSPGLNVLTIVSKNKYNRETFVTRNVRLEANQ